MTATPRGAVHSPAPCGQGTQGAGSARGSAPTNPWQDNSSARDRYPDGRTPAYVHQPTLVAPAGARPRPLIPPPKRGGGILDVSAPESPRRLGCSGRPHAAGRGVVGVADGD